jgi:hypothetical protein
MVFGLGEKSKAVFHHEGQGKGNFHHEGHEEHEEKQNQESGFTITSSLKIGISILWNSWGRK